MRRRRPTYFWKLFRLKAQWISSSATLRTATGDWMVTWVLPGGFSNHHVCIEVGAPMGIPSKTTWVLFAPWKLRPLSWPRSNAIPSSSDGRKPSLRPERNWPGATGCSCQTEELRCRPHPTVRMVPHSSPAPVTTQLAMREIPDAPSQSPLQVNPLLLH